MADRIPLPFKIFSGEGGTDLDIKTGLIKGGVETAEDDMEQEVTVVVVVEFILTLAPSAFTRLGIFSKLTTGTGTHGLSLDPFAEKTVCCLLLEVRRLSLGVLNGFEVLLAEFWPLRQALVFTCTNDVLELEGGDAGEGEGLHIDPCLLSAEEERRELSTSRVAGEPHMLTHTQIHKRQREKRLSCRVGTPKPQL